MKNENVMDEASNTIDILITWLRSYPKTHVDIRSNDTSIVVPDNNGRR